jgi:hypothetical protein
MRDIELQKVADHAHDKPILQSEARKELFARHQEDLKRQEEQRKELETDTYDLDPAPQREPPAPAPPAEDAPAGKENNSSDGCGTCDGSYGNHDKNCEVKKILDDMDPIEIDCPECSGKLCIGKNGRHDENCRLFSKLR